MLDLAQHIIARKEGPFEPATFEDRYETALEDLVKAKQHGKPPKTPAAAPKPSNVINLMDALRKSLGSKESARERQPDGDDDDAPRETRARKSSPARKKPARSHSRKAG